jgi:hypothetical protein
LLALVLDIGELLVNALLQMLQFIAEKYILIEEFE